MTGVNFSSVQDEIRALARQRDAVILAHNYQRPEVQDVADFVGDSLGLSRQAAATDNAAIVFCGVHFMAETAAILAPAKTVLIPDADAGCSLAASITAEQLRTWKAENPGAVVVAAAAAHRVFLQTTQPGRRLAGIEDRRACALYKVDVPPRQRSNTTQPANQVQRRPFTGQHPTRATVDLGQGRR